jgi:uncharacterized protein YyaL (SSP411 family)
MSQQPNHLIRETSPYLLQHAHNPVDWYPWGPEALGKARRENKPLLVSIGYSACHWCHVMERESFEDETTAAIMNEYFVNIKIDREERPDLDHIYMDAVQALTGSGGWPLNVFLTPDLKPFYGGTYFPPLPAHGRPSWKDVLHGVHRAFTEKKEAIGQQAESLTEHLLQANNFGLQSLADETYSTVFSKDSTDDIYKNLLQSADRQWGGFGRAPKFPQTFVLQFLLRYYWLTKEPAALQQATLSIDSMLRGGIYDQVGGGFARYSTDAEWLVPHFEKMLYDNALLTGLLCEAFQLTGKERYLAAIRETMDFMQREMMTTENAFYAALDADSEGEEGKFYVWNYDEVAALLGNEAPVFCGFYDITPGGNWEGKNILRIKTDRQFFATEQGLSEKELDAILQRGKSILLQERNRRVRPGTDDKIILGWNALMNSACSRVFQVTGDEIYQRLAISNMHFLLAHFWHPDNEGFLHVWKNGVAKYPAFLDDYAFLIQALCDLYEITTDVQWLAEADRLARLVADHFQEPDTGFFFFTGKTQQDVLLRKKEVYDGAVPSGNAAMATNLLRLSIYLDKPLWRRQAEGMLQSLGRAVIKYPSSFGAWACCLQQFVYGTQEIAIVGEDYLERLREVSRAYLPHKVLMAAPQANQDYPLLAGRGKTGETLLYLCKDFSCRQPVHETSALLKQAEP